MKKAENRSAARCVPGQFTGSTMENERGNVDDLRIRPALSRLKASVASTKLTVKANWTRATLNVSCVTLR